jgi:hypothetical protein
MARIAKPINVNVWSGKQGMMKQFHTANILKHTSRDLTLITTITFRRNRVATEEQSPKLAGCIYHNFTNIRKHVTI